MTNDELRAALLADPETAEIAEEQGMTVEEYVAETLAYCDDPDRGFAGCRDAPDCEESLEAAGGPAPDPSRSAFETRAPPRVPRHEPGAGVVGTLPSFRARCIAG